MTSAERRGEIQRAVLQVLAPSPEAIQARDAINRVAEIARPTDFEKSDYPNRPGVQRFNKIVRFHSIGLVKAGWIVKSKGQWQITEEGRKALERLRDPRAVEGEVARLYRVWKKSQPEPEVDETAEVEGEAEPAVTLEEADENAWTEISRYLEEMNPYDFQRLVARLLEAMGYHIAWIAEPGPDRGLDILAYTDALGASGPRIKVQVKRRSDKMTAEGLRSFLAVLGDHDVGIFVATAGFTKDAEIEWRSQQQRKVTLLDMHKLVDLWVKHYERLTDDARSLLPLRPVYYLAPRE